MSTYPLNVKHVLDDEWMDCLVEMAGYGMGYWAHTAVMEDGKYTVYWRDEDTGREKHKAVTYGGLARAVQKIIGGDVVNQHYTDQTNRALYDAGDIDSDLADVIVQVALFGETVYG